MSEPIQTEPTGPAPGISELEATRLELVAFQAELHRLRTTAATPGIAHALRLADTYLFLALGYGAHSDELFPEEGSVDVGSACFPNLR